MGNASRYRNLTHLLMIWSMLNQSSILGGILPPSMFSQVGVNMLTDTINNSTSTSRQLFNHPGFTHPGDMRIFGTPEDDDMIYFHYPRARPNPWTQMHQGFVPTVEELMRPGWDPSLHSMIGIKPTLSQQLQQLQQIQQIPSISGLGNNLDAGQHLLTRPEHSLLMTNPLGQVTGTQLHPSQFVERPQVPSFLDQYSDFPYQQNLLQFGSLTGPGSLQQAILNNQQAILSNNLGAGVHQRPQETFPPATNPWQFYDIKDPQVPPASFTVSEDGHKLIDTLDPNFLSWAMNRTQVSSKPVVVMVTGNNLPMSMLTDKPNIDSIFQSPEHTMLHVDLDKSTIQTLSAELLHSMAQKLKLKKPIVPKPKEPPVVLPSPPAYYAVPYMDSNMGGTYEGPTEHVEPDLFSIPMNFLHDIGDKFKALFGRKPRPSDWQMFNLQNPQVPYPQASYKEESVTLSNPGDHGNENNKNVVQGVIPAMESKWLKFILQKLLKPLRNKNKLVLAPNGLDPNAYIQNRMMATILDLMQNSTMYQLDTDNTTESVNNTTEYDTENKQAEARADSHLDFDVQAVITPR